jgi:tetratricopeptide (TPR) repeat protein
MTPGRRAPLTPALAGFFMAAALLLAGCATPQVSRLAQDWPTELPSQTVLTGVPFFPQEDFECGPAALAMVLQAAGIAVTPEALQDQVYLPQRKGSLQVEMLAATRRQGLPAYLIKPQLQTVLQEVAAGHPVLVFQNLSLPVYPVWHYAVVVGFDRARNVVILHSGRTARMEMSLFAFERTWARGGYWAMVALPLTELAASAEPDSWAQALAALERRQPQAASQAYATALQRWPDHASLMLGLGNAAYAQGQLGRAEAAYRAAVQAHTTFADAWNNLAQVLLDMERRPEAATAIARAVALGGPRLERYQQLQQSIPAPSQ